MYTSATMTTPAASAQAGANIAPIEPPEKMQAFDRVIDADGRIEPQDWMPQAYRKTLVRSRFVSIQCRRDIGGEP